MADFDLPDRRHLFDVLSEDEIVSRYRRVWGDEFGLEHVKAQAALEGKLTDRLLSSTRENRWSEFSECYNRLFKELPWHTHIDDDARFTRDHKVWNALIGGRRKLIEIGSGGGGLIRYLANQGHECFGTDVSQERGEKWVAAQEGLKWLTLDGVNLSRFLDENAFDAILSDQVFEHLHPDDHLVHLREARKILRDGGIYILRAPHRATGPHDLTKVFGLDRPVFMHLCEPDYRLMDDLRARAGFRKMTAVLAIRRFGIVIKSRPLALLQRFYEQMEEKFGASATGRRRLRELTKFLMVLNYVWIVMEK